MRQPAHERIYLVLVILYGDATQLAAAHEIGGFLSSQCYVSVVNYFL
ncbi:hypothetical protein PCIT_a4408 [Pseudoalteromonas citrea]|uniref:Uncharacterized protein n=1 Tax=Pseudoalteromonas citrea TaxID=43655 RepID=A0AAD4FQL5_9GAMM|nr:hypothetical protein PCIT_a4408 [Pseudoalteromonas citrea]